MQAAENISPAFSGLARNAGRSDSAVFAPASVPGWAWFLSFWDWSAVSLGLSVVLSRSAFFLFFAFFCLVSLSAVGVVDIGGVGVDVAEEALLAAAVVAGIVDLWLRRGGHCSCLAIGDKGCACSDRIILDVSSGYRMA